MVSHKGFWRFNELPRRLNFNHEFGMPIVPQSTGLLNYNRSLSYLLALVNNAFTISEETRVYDDRFEMVLSSISIHDEFSLSIHPFSRSQKNTYRIQHSKSGRVDSSRWVRLRIQTTRMITVEGWCVKQFLSFVLLSNLFKHLLHLLDHRFRPKYRCSPT